MKATLDLLTGTLSSTTSLETSSAGVFMTSAYSAPSASHQLYLDGAWTHGPIIDTAGVATSIQEVDVLGQKRALGSVQPGLFFEFNGTGSHIRVDTFTGIRKNDEFTIKCLSVIENNSKNTIFAIDDGSDLGYELYVENGTLYFRYNGFTANVTITGSAVTNSALTAIGLSIQDGVAYFGVNGSTTTASMPGELVFLRSQPIYIGGNKARGTGYLQGLMGRIQYQNIPTTDFSSWTVVNQYATDRPYVDIDFSTTSILTSSGITFYNIATTTISGTNCSFGYTFSLDGGSTWETPTRSAWDSSSGTDAIGLESDLNEYMRGRSDIYSGGLRVRVFFFSDGTEQGGLSSLSMRYVNDDNPLDIGSAAALKYGSEPAIFSDSFIHSTVETSSITVSIDTGSGAVEYHPSFSLHTPAEMVRNEFRALRESKMPIDGYIVDPETLLGGGLLSSSVTVSWAAGTYSATQTYSVQPYYITLRVLNAAGTLINPTVNIFYTDISPNPSAIDGYQGSASSVTFLSLPKANYKFSLEDAYEVDDRYTWSQTVDKDETIRVARSYGHVDRTTVRVGGISLNHLSLTRFATGDTPTLKFQVIDKERKLPKNIDGYNVFFSMKRAYSDHAVVVDRACTVTNASTGKASVQLTTGDTAEAGRFIAEVTVENDTEVLTALPHFYVDVVSDIH